jgi:hypothetical protein
MYRIPPREGVRLYKYVASVEIGFNPWDSKSTSTRELWRRLSSAKMVKSNPKVELSAKMPVDLKQPFTKLKFLDGSTLHLEDTSTMRVEEIFSEINMGAARIDNQYMKEGKELDDD